MSTPSGPEFKLFARRLVSAIGGCMQQRKGTDEEMAGLNLKSDNFHRDGNDTISPRTKKRERSFWGVA